MMMKHNYFFTILAVALTFGTSGALSAQTFDVIEDFEGYAIDSTVYRYQISGSACKAVVEADPTDATNKVCHVTTTSASSQSVLNLKNYVLPEGVRIRDYKYLVFDYYRNPSDQNGCLVYLSINASTVWQDPWNASPSTTGRWQRRVISLDKASTFTSNKIARLYVGLLGANKDYYIDNIRLVRELDAGYDLADETTSLRYWADKCELNLGVAMADGDNWFYSSNAVSNDNSTWRNVFTGLFNTTVCGNEMKVDATEPSRNTFSYTNPDRLVALARQKGMRMRGHTLVWHSQLPSWMGGGEEGMYNNNNYTREQLLAIMKNHITNVVSHFKGKVYEWDVVNEAIDPWNGTADHMRRSIWYQVIGPDYIDSAFVYAHAADPDARLVINDYGAEYDGETKAADLLNLAKRLKSNGIPITGVGLQFHTSLGDISRKKSQIRSLLLKYRAAGLDVSITELDVAIPASKFDNATAWSQQASDYKALLDVALTSANCHTYVIWGMADSFSWIPGQTKYASGQPLILDDLLQAKPAFLEMRKLLQARAAALGIESPSADASAERPQRVDVFTLQGVRVARDVDADEAAASLPPGAYIIGGRKVLVR